MTGFKDCLTTAAVRGMLEHGKAQEALALFDDMVKELKAQGLSEEASKSQAAQQATEQVRYEVARRKKQVVLGNSVRNRILADLAAYTTPKGDKSWGAAALALIERDEYGTSTSYSGKKAVVMGQAHARMEALLQKYQPKKSGTVRPKAGLDNVIREVFGEDTGDAAAKELATAWKDTAEYMRQRANLAGADIAKRDDWHFPQSHDWAKVAKVGKQPWVDYMMSRVDFARMFNSETGRPLSHLDAAGQREALAHVYDTIKTNGYVKLDGTAGGGSGMLANRMGEQRFLQFKDSKSWMEYQERFGHGNAFDAMINHVDHMSQQISMLETFGPNPEMMRRYIKAQVKKHAGELDAANPNPAARSFVTEEDKQLRKFDEMWGTITNQNALLNGDWMGFTLAGTRNLLTSAHLGSASLVAIPADFLSVKMTKKFNKIPATDFLKHYISLMNPANDADKRLAVRLGLIAESASSIAYGQQRLLGQITGPQFTRRIADTVMRLSLMTPHTQASRWAFGMEFLGALADHNGKAFDELPFKQTLSRYGMNAREWDDIRRTPLYSERGATFLRPDDIISSKHLQPAKARQLADKVMEMVIGESRIAIQEPTIRARAFLLGDSKPGTLGGELSRSMAMFKNFPVTLMMIHSRRNMLNAAMGGSKFGYAAAFGLGLTMLGALSSQLRQMAQGRDPINMNPATPEGRRFWGNATLTGGGLGIWGDFLFKDVNRFGGGPQETAAGPVLGWATDTAKLTAGNLIEAAQGKDTHFLAEGLRYGQRYMPGGSIWYSRLLLQREVFDQLQEMADPDAHSKWRRAASEMRKDYGQDSWWQQGQSAPRRAPNLKAAWQ